MTTIPSYHDLVIQVAGMPEPMSIFDLPYWMLVTCTRAGGWEVWRKWEGKEELLGGEYAGDGKPLYLGLKNGTPIVGKQIAFAPAGCELA